MAFNANAKSALNVKKLVIWASNGDGTYGSAIDFGERIQGFDDTLTTNTTTQYADGIPVDSYTGTGEGALQYTLTELTAAERATLYGQDVSGSLVTLAGDEIIPDVMCAHMTVRSDGKVNLYKYAKVKFAPHQETAAQIENGQATFSGITLNGTYGVGEVSVTSEGTTTTETWMKKVYRGADPTTDATLISNWFTTASFTG